MNLGVATLKTGSFKTKVEPIVAELLVIVIFIAKKYYSQITEENEVNNFE